MADRCAATSPSARVSRASSTSAARSRCLRVPMRFRASCGARSERARRRSTRHAPIVLSTSLSISARRTIAPAGRPSRGTSTPPADRALIDRLEARFPALGTIVDAPIARRGHRPQSRVRHRRGDATTHRRRRSGLRRVHPPVREGPRHPPLARQRCRPLRHHGRSRRLSAPRLSRSSRAVPRGSRAETRWLAGRLDRSKAGLVSLARAAGSGRSARRVAPSAPALSGYPDRTGLRARSHGRLRPRHHGVDAPDR